MAVHVGDLVDSIKSDATPPAERDRTIVAALGIIEAFARRATRSRRKEVSVSLALYEGSGMAQMSIRHRNPGNERPIGRPLRELESVLGHRACRAGVNPRVVSDLKRFGKKGFRSPTHSSCDYRSILIVPMTSTERGNVKGFLSIDCATPHAFHGSVAEKLLVDCEPLIDHIRHQI